MLAYLRILRPHNCMLSALAVAVAGLMAVGVRLFTAGMLAPLAFAALTVFLFTGAGNVLNDVYDAETDTINHPERPIPSGQMTKKSAQRYVMILFALGLVAAAMVNVLTLAIAGLNLYVMGWYERSSKGRGLPGNLTVSYLTGSLFLFAGAAFSGIPGIATMFGASTEPSGGVLALMSLLAFLAGVATLGREVAKDIEDMEGDVDRMTLPRQVGKRQAGRFALLAFLLAAALSPLPFMLGFFGAGYLVIVAVADAIFIYSGAVLFNNPHRASVLSKVAMALALVAFVVGGLVR